MIFLAVIPAATRHGHEHADMSASHTCWWVEAPFGFHPPVFMHVLNLHIRKVFTIGWGGKVGLWIKNKMWRIMRTETKNLDSRITYCLFVHLSVFLIRWSLLNDHNHSFVLRENSAEEDHEMWLKVLDKASKKGVFFGQTAVYNVKKKLPRLT